MGSKKGVVKLEQVEFAQSRKWSLADRVNHVLSVIPVIDWRGA